MEITERQKALIIKLLNEAGIPRLDIETHMGRSIDALDKDSASAIIDALTKRDDDILNSVLDNIRASEQANEQSNEEQKLPENTKSIVGKATDLARYYGIPDQLANMFFMSFSDQLYIKNPGLLYLAAKKGYSRIVTKSSYNEEKKEWIAETDIYPVIPPEVLKAISSLDKDMQRRIIEGQYGPTHGEGRASEENVNNKRMMPFLKELAETRSVNRALRLFTGYGGTSYEELPEGEVEVEK